LTFGLETEGQNCENPSIHRGSRARPKGFGVSAEDGQQRRAKLANAALRRGAVSLTQLCGTSTE